MQAFPSTSLPIKIALLLFLRRTLVANFNLSCIIEFHKNLRLDCGRTSAAFSFSHQNFTGSSTAESPATGAFAASVHLATRVVVRAFSAIPVRRRRAPYVFAGVTGRTISSNSRKINTCKIASKQTTLIFRNQHLCKNRGGVYANPSLATVSFCRRHSRSLALHSPVKARSSPKTA
jgi:hypothetical protein